MYEKELKRAERLLENEFGTEWKKIVQTLGVWDLTHCIGRDLTSFIAYGVYIRKVWGNGICIRK